MTTRTTMTAPTAASEGSTIVDVRLFKAICLHQILHPAHGGNRYYRVAFKAAMWLTFCVHIVQFIGLFFAVNDLQRFAFSTTVVSTAFLSLLKGYMMVVHADRLRSCLEAVRYDCTSGSARNQRTVRRSRAVLSKVLRTFAVVSWFTCTIWVASPLLTTAYVPLTNNDGTVSRYRVTIYNTWLPVPVTVYNETLIWALVYAVEAIMCIFIVFSWLLFDSYVVTMCFAFNAQFHTLSAGYGTIGHRDHFGSPAPHDTGTNNVKNNDNTLNCYDELINHIKDNQNIIKKYDDFFDVIKPVVLFQIISCSYAVITLIFLTVLTYLMGFSIISAPVLKVFFGFLSLAIQLFIYCFIFNYIETEKAKVNFGLYSSNWTEMDLKFKKILLLAMNMNSAHRRVMKVTPKSIVNLEMFSNVMHMSYSIVSVLLNSRAEK